MLLLNVVVAHEAYLQYECSLGRAGNIADCTKYYREANNVKRI